MGRRRTSWTRGAGDGPLDELEKGAGLGGNGGGKKRGFGATPFIWIKDTAEPLQVAAVHYIALRFL